jgi:sec-independent protein translocase protein TatA
MPAALPLTTVCPLAFLEGIGGMEMLLVFVIGLLLFGGKGLPDMARTAGKAIREFKKATASVEDQLKRVIEEEEPAAPAPRRAPPAVYSRPVELPPVPAPDATASPPPAAPATPPPSDGSGAGPAGPAANPPSP